MAKKDSAVFWFTDAYFGSHINYCVINKTLVARARANVSPTLSVGEVVIEYMFKYNMMKPSSIKFEVFDNPNVFFNYLSTSVTSSLIISPKV